MIEGTVVILSDAVVEPVTVMVEVQAAPIAHPTVFGRFIDETITYITPQMQVGSIFTCLEGVEVLTHSFEFLLFNDCRVCRVRKSSFNCELAHLEEDEGIWEQNYYYSI